jgi:hypothetical protein
MTKDLIQRLRSLSDGDADWAIRVEAAAEIEHLKRENAQLQAAIDDALEWCYKENIYGHVRNALEIASTSDEPNSAPSAAIPEQFCERCGVRLAPALDPAKHLCADQVRHKLGAAVKSEACPHPSDDRRKGGWEWCVRCGAVISHEHEFVRMDGSPVGYACECGESPPVGWYPESDPS